MGYEGNRRYGEALAMRHRLSGLSTYGLKGQCAGDEHPAYASGHGPFTLRTDKAHGFKNLITTRSRRTIKEQRS